MFDVNLIETAMIWKCYLICSCVTFIHLFQTSIDYTPTPTLPEYPNYSACCIYCKMLPTYIIFDVNRATYNTELTIKITLSRNIYVRLKSMAGSKSMADS